MFGTIWSSIFGGADDPVITSMNTLVTNVGDLVGDLLPIGIGLIFVMAMPRIIRRVVNTFL